MPTTGYGFAAGGRYDPQRVVAVVSHLYSDLAEWWPLVSAPADYRDEADFYARVLLTGGAGSAPTLLELGCGGGNNASWLKAHFRCTLVDRSAGMIAVSRTLNPTCEHVVGDMREVRLERLFDHVFVHDAIAYMTTEPDLRAALETAFVHCAPGGTALFVPDHVTESFEPSTGHGGHDADGRALRFVEWITGPSGDGRSYTVDYAFLLRERDGTVRVVGDRHTCGLFARATWQSLLTDVGFEPLEVPSDGRPAELAGHPMFLGRRPG